MATPPDAQFPDYRFTLANERTYLAYLRTSLACYAGGLSAVQFLKIDGERWPARVIGVVLVVTGMITTATAIRGGEPLPVTRLPAILAVSIGGVGLVGLLFSVLR